MDQQGPQAKEAERVYHKLRTAVVENVAKEYRRTGYVWEQYNDETGEGQGCRTVVNLNQRDHLFEN